MAPPPAPSPSPSSSASSPSSTTTTIGTLSLRKKKKKNAFALSTSAIPRLHSSSSRARTCRLTSSGTPSSRTRSSTEGRTSSPSTSTPGPASSSTSPPPAHFFYGRQLRRSVKVGWGEPSMIEAERMLLAAALDDPANQRFILLSESCVPLYNFSYTYSYLMSSSKSFVDSFLDEKETRYNPKMSPTISKETWRKGSQWITLVRKHAVVVVSDEIIFPVFKRHCKRRPELNLEEKHKIKPIILQHNCIPDEHYVQTLLSMSGLEHELEKRTLTYTSWNRSKNVKGKQTWHPITFEYVNGSPKQINAIKGINHVDYQTEFRTEWCRCNSTFVPCYLFARKFSRGAAMRILTEGFVGTFNAASLLVQNSL
ncbi:uncharacterized protein M6B38_137150 [Iris pallida]|uniref:Uncharacterized protein n=1 Tax=Iris pallida TaxID=29817 RepID=A0AAX6FFE2_IRIPA|nr:uncharacterized protein M6B38_137150 [Iris pallida]